MFCEIIGNRFDNPELLESPNKMDAQEKQGNYAEYSKEWEEFDRYADALPQEAWIA